MKNARLGILMLDTRFPRILGDVGNPASFDFPVRYHVVPGATPEAIVLSDPRPWTEAFIAAGRALVDQGCTGLATTCGFLTLARDEVQAACGVPVASSALEEVPRIAAVLPPGQVPGIITISQASLSPAHLAAARVAAGTPVIGVDRGSFARSILSDAETLDVPAARREMIEAARQLCADHPEVGAIVLECTNMPPHADAVADATGRPVHSILTYLNRFHAELT
ncbi:aspartate/glutamate racemase family protein [Aliishimia ponticola]|uniref:Aspartate/glutamate racemase family protein n=1 Tax=Aliishimia ponticola TaxID=2499833 RepID=A0A4S4NBU8_9RHOB|nr:aspartate/glutamate racemase family protein [Aliishimia ponticola]THH36882.1 aspartate/glutamate racemase family protein [Aliishimia ponticola]